MRPARRAALLACAATAALAASSGCRPDFAPYNRVQSLRVLGMKSEPAAPITGDTGTLSALVFTPTDDPSLTYAWSWCPVPGAANDGYPCLVDEATLDTIADGIPTPRPPPYDLGTDPTAMLANAIDPTFLGLVCAGMLPGIPVKPDCTYGFPFQVKLTVKTDTDQVDAVETMRWRFAAPATPTTPAIPATPINANPIIDALEATIAGNPVPIADPPVATLPRTVATPLHADMSEANAEMYDGPVDANGNPTTLVERLFLTWFVETGDTNDSRTSFISGSTAFPDMLVNSWTPAAVKDYPAGTARLFVVAHDSRGGVGWQQGTVNLEDAP